MADWTIIDSDGVGRIRGTLVAEGGATGDVPTQQADGTFAPAAGGGSQSFEHIIVPIAFDTPGLVIPAAGAAGIKVTDLAAGDIPVSFVTSFSAAFGFLSISEVWDGTTPVLHQVIGPANRGNLPGTQPTPYEPTATPLADLTLIDTDLTGDGILIGTSNQVPIPDTGDPAYFAVDTSYYVYVDDGSGGDPGSLQGAGTLHLFIYRAAP